MVRYKPVKVLVVKSIYEKLQLLAKGIIDDDCLKAVDLLLKKVEDGQREARGTDSPGISFTEIMGWIPAGAIIYPNHGRAGSSIGQFCRTVHELGATQEDFARLTFRGSMPLEKFTALLPSLLTEARGRKDDQGCRPPIFSEG